LSHDFPGFILDFIQEAAESNPHISVCVSESTRGALTAGITTLFGGIFLGPIGLFLGGSLGGLIAYSISGHYDSFFEIWNKKMSQEEKKSVCSKCA